MSLLQDVTEYLVSHNLSLSLAESCTGGLLSHQFTKLAGAAQYYCGGVTTYSLAAKENVLGVSKELLDRYGAVSEECALSMAENCRRLFDSNWAIATTGLSGPGGENEGQPIGIVFIGIAGKNVLMAERYVFADVSRLQHRQKIFETSLVLMKKIICQSSP